MSFVVVPLIGTLTLNASNFISLHPALINEIAGHGLAHVLYSHVRKSSRSRGISRRQARMVTNRRRRWFVDNIIMHHKRIHDRNRELVVKDARTKALERRKKLEKEQQQIESAALEHKRENSTNWHQQALLKQRGNNLKERYQARRLRAQSRWSVVMQMKKEESES